MARYDGRQPGEIRPVKITTGFITHPEGSVLIECGNTKVICNATIEAGVPPFLRDTGKGWVTAEYAMLPRATDTRNRRDIAKLKKSTPAHAAAAWAQALQAGLRADDEALEHAKQADAAAAAANGLAIQEHERQAELEKRYADAVAGLERLKKDMPSVVARLERARGAGGYVVTER